MHGNVFYPDRKKKVPKSAASQIALMSQKIMSFSTVMVTASVDEGKGEYTKSLFLNSKFYVIKSQQNKNECKCYVILTL
jgi:hypothetical protein